MSTHKSGASSSYLSPTTSHEVGGGRQFSYPAKPNANQRDINIKMFSAITFALFLLVCNAYAQLSYGIFGYYPTGAVPMLPGFNQRLYNRVEVAVL
jgi:hypothetical protein